jgi:hypothetical protein
METNVLSAESQLNKKPLITITTAFIPESKTPIGKSLLLATIIPMISNPPVDPEQRKTIPTPSPVKAPPNIDERIVSFAISWTGTKYRPNDIINTEKIEFKTNFLPSILYPIINNGKFKRKFASPVLRGVIIPKIIDIPLSPLLNTSWGIKKRLNPTTTIRDPIIIPINLTEKSSSTCHISFKK